MKLQCLIKSRYPGNYNRDMDFGALGIARVVEGVADVGPELANVMVASGNFVRIDEFKSPDVSEDDAISDADLAGGQPTPPKKKRGRPVGYRP